jgi:hypothetical protein
MNVLVVCRAVCRGPKGVVVMLRWIRLTEYSRGNPFAIDLPALRRHGARIGNESEPPTFTIVGINVSVKTPVGWGCSSDALPPSNNSLSIGGPLLPKTGDLVISCAPLEGWFEVIP